MQTKELEQTENDIDLSNIEEHQYMTFLLNNEFQTHLA